MSHFCRSDGVSFSPFAPVHRLSFVVRGHGWWGGGGCQCRWGRLCGLRESSRRRQTDGYIPILSVGGRRASHKHEVSAGFALVGERHGGETSCRLAVMADRPVQTLGEVAGRVAEPHPTPSNRRRVGRLVPGRGINWTHPPDGAVRGAVMQGLSGVRQRRSTIDDRSRRRLGE